jgi:hypothetical protein
VPQPLRVADGRLDARLDARQEDRPEDRLDARQEAESAVDVRPEAAAKQYKPLQQ